MDLSSPPPRTEAQRLAALDRYGILDTAREQAFDDIARLVAHVCQTPIALINFVGAGRQWFKSEIGLSVQKEVPLDVSFCVHAIRAPDLLVVPDAARDDRFQRNPLVAGEPFIRFYAGAPLETADGDRIGTLCVLDDTPRELTDAQRDALRALARQAMSQLELRRVAAEQARALEARQRAEADARRSEARLGAMLGASLDCIIGMDRDGRVTEWNAAAEQTFGYARDEAMGREMAELIIPPEYRDAHRRGLAHHLATGEGRILGRRMELSALRRDGTAFPVELTVTRVAGDGPPAFTGFVRDLTEAKRVDEARRMNEVRWQRLVEQSPLSTQTFGPDGTVRRVNRAWEALWGITLADIPGYNILADQQLVELGIMPAIRRAFEGEPATAEPIPYTLDRGRFAGRPRWCGAFVYPVKDDAGRIEEVVLVHNDVTEQRAAEAALRTSEQRLRSLVEQSAAGIAHTDLDGRIDFANARFCEIVGYPCDEVVGLRVHDLTHPDDLAETARRVADGAASGREYAMEKRYVRKDGSVVWVAVSASILKNASGTPQSIMGVVFDISDRKRAEAEIGQAKEAAERDLARWHAVVDSMTEGLVVTDAAGNVRTMNPAALAMHGFGSAEAMFGRVGDFPGLFEGRDAEGRVLPLEEWPVSRVLRGERFTGYEVEVTRRDTGTRWIGSYGGTPVRDADGQLQQAVLTLRDVTAQRRAQAALRSSEELVRTIAENSTQGLAMMNERGYCTYANRAWLDMTGYSAEEIGSRPLHDLVHHHYPDGRPFPKEECPIDRALPENYDVRAHADLFFRKDGTSFPVSVAASPIFKEGRPVSTVIEIRDVTHARRAEAERARLLESERAAREEAETLADVGRTVSGELDLNSLVQKVTDATTSLTRAQFGAFFYNVINEQGESLSLYTLSGASRADFAADPTPRATALFGPTSRGEGAIRTGDVTKDDRFGKNGPYRGLPSGHLPVRSYLAVPVAARSGEVLGGLFFGHDEPDVFTERDERLVLGIAAQAAVAMDNARLYEAARRANEAKGALLASEQAARSEAERASRMKDEFLATLSHELRTPLNAVLGWATIIRRPGTRPADVAQGLDVIERNARAQAQIIEDLLDMSRIISGKARLDVRPLALEPILRAAVESATPAADAKGITIEAALDPRAGSVSGDPSRLGQVFWNLLSNAVKFTPRGGRVRVTLVRHGAHVEASVADTGEGIRPEFLPHVFDRFRQADASITRRHGGLGLGLSIVKQLVELHGGAIRAASGGEGAGATFTVSLPLADTSRPDAPRSAAAKQPQPVEEAPATSDLCASIAGVKVLVVDDEPDARALVRRLLEDCDAVVTTAASSAEALEQFRAGRPDVIVSDIGMPGEDGYTFIARLRTLEGGDVPALALTAYARPEDRTRAIRAGFELHVPKPVDPAELITMVASLAGRA